MKCPYCAIDFRENWSEINFIRAASMLRQWSYRCTQCPECKEVILAIARRGDFGGMLEDLQIYPTSATRRSIPREAPAEIAQVYTEACAVLPISPYASAVLARLCLQTMLHAHGYKSGELPRNLDLLVNEPDQEKSLPCSSREIVKEVQTLAELLVDFTDERIDHQVIAMNPPQAAQFLAAIEELFDHFYAQPPKAAASDGKMFHRIIYGFGAGAFAQVVNIVIQLLSLPIFLLYWDTSSYGSWLMLSAVPSYLTMADVGMVQAAGNKMTMAMGRLDTAEANQVFQSAQLFMMLVCFTIGIVVTPLALWGPLPDFISTDQRIALAVLFCDVLVAMFGGLSESVFKATGRFGLGLLISSIVRLLEWAGFMLGLFFFGTFAGVATVGFLVRIVGTGVSILVAQIGDHGLQWGTAHASKDEIKTIIRPAVSFMAFPLANALSFQGVTLLVGALFGPSSVAIFNTYRTISRIAVQLTGMFSHALWPEFGRLFGNEGPKGVESLYRRSFLLGAIQSLGLSAILFLISPWLLNLWTHGRIEFYPVLMAWMLTYAAMGGIWHVPRVLLQSTNQHVGLALWSLVAGALSVLLSWTFAVEWQINGVAAATLVSEIFIATICVYLAHHSFVGISKMKD